MFIDHFNTTKMFLIQSLKNLSLTQESLHSEQEAIPLLPRLDYDPVKDKNLISSRKLTLSTDLRLPEPKQALRLRWINIVLEGFRHPKAHVCSLPSTPQLQALSPSLNAAQPNAIVDIDPRIKPPHSYLLTLSDSVAETQMKVRPQPSKGAFRSKSIDSVEEASHQQRQLACLVGNNNVQSDQIFATQLIEYQLLGPDPLKLQQLEVVHLTLENIDPAQPQNFSKAFELLSRAIQTLHNQGKSVRVHSELYPRTAQILVFYHHLREKLLGNGTHYTKADFLHAFDQTVIDLRKQLVPPLKQLNDYLFILSKLYQELIEHHLLEDTVRLTQTART